MALSALLLELGLTGGLSRFQALAQAVDGESVQSPVAPAAVITSQIRAPNKDAYVTERGSMAVSGIAWGEGTDLPYLTDDPHVSLQRINENAYYVKWTSVISADDYLLQEATDPTFGPDDIVFSGVVIDTSRPFNKPGDEGTYYYRVQAATPDVENPSRWSNVVAVTVPWLEGGASTLSADIDATSAVTVQVRIGEPDEIETTEWHTAEVAETTWEGWEWSYVWDLPETRETQYLIQARASDGEDGFGAVDAITVTVDNQIFFAYFPVLARRWPPVPYSPELEEINNPNEWVEYTLRWSYSDPGTGVPEPDSYTVQETDNAEFSGAETYTTTQMSRDIDDEQQEKHNGTYYYRVRGNNAYGPGEWSNVETTTLRVTPRAPSLKPVDKADEETSYTVRWSYDHAFPADQPTSYVLEEAANAAFTVGRQQYEVKDGTSKVFKNKSEGTYYYRVRGKNSYGLGAWSNTVGPVRVEAFSYFDDFSDYQSGWPREWSYRRGALYRVRPYEHPGCGPGQDCKYAGGDGYVIARRNDGTPLARFGPEIKVPGADYEITFDARWFESFYWNTYQVFFGSDESFQNYYGVQVRYWNETQGCEYSIVKDDDHNFLERWTHTSALKCDVGDGGDWDRWRIRREGSAISVWVNDVKLGTWTNSAYGADRYFGVGATVHEYIPSKPEFDNWSVELLD